MRNACRGKKCGDVCNANPNPAFASSEIIPGLCDERLQCTLNIKDIKCKQVKGQSISVDKNYHSYVYRIYLVSIRI